MKHRLCIDMDDWCNKPTWHTSEQELVPVPFTARVIREEEYKGELIPVVTAQQRVKFQFDINCDDGRICCRFLLGSDITQEY